MFADPIFFTNAVNYSFIGKEVENDLTDSEFNYLIENINKMLDSKKTPGNLKDSIQFFLKCNDSILKITKKEKSDISSFRLTSLFLNSGFYNYVDLRDSFEELSSQLESQKMSSAINFFIQLRNIHQITEKEKLELAKSIELAKENHSEMSPKQVKFIHTSLCEAPCNFLQRVYYVACNKIDHGTFKEVSKAIQVSFDSSLPTVLVASSLNKNQAGYKIIKKESEKHKKFSGHEGIWPLLHSYKYKDESGSKKICLITPLADCNLHNIVKRKIDKSFSLGDLIDIAYQISCGLDHIHTNGYFHFDIKSRNTLLSFERIIAGLCDFGHTFKIEEIRSIIHNGIYGTIEFTAPELFGNKDFDGDFFKVEIWALGCLFYSIVQKKSLPWTPIMKEARSKKIDQEIIAQMHLKIKETIEQEHFSIKGKKRSTKEDYLLLIYDMLRLDPALRPLDVKTIISRIEILKAKWKEEKNKPTLNFEDLIVDKGAYSNNSDLTPPPKHDWSWLNESEEF